MNLQFIAPVALSILVLSCSTIQNAARWIFSKVPLQKVGGSTLAERRLWREGICDQTLEVMSLQGSMSIERMCQLAQLQRLWIPTQRHL
jgi:hypothetical protein